MTRRDTTFNAQDAMTPDFAAALAHRASGYAANVYLERGSTRLSVDSLIGILALNIRRGMKVAIVADGYDAPQAVDCVCAILSEGMKKV